MLVIDITFTSQDTTTAKQGGAKAQACSFPVIQCKDLQSWYLRNLGIFAAMRAKVAL
jgi:hypothetical protein